MSTQQKPAGGFSSLVAALAIALSLVIGFLVYKFIFGDPSHFQENGDPIEGDYLGIIYKGGLIVPFLLATNIVVITFVIERFVNLGQAKGKGSLKTFVLKMKEHLSNNDIASAKEECDTQKGSLANVVHAGLTKYEHIKNETDMTKDEKIESLKKELEEATALEMPMLSKNLVILSTAASVSTFLAAAAAVSFSASLSRCFTSSLADAAAASSFSLVSSSSGNVAAAAAVSSPLCFIFSSVLATASSSADAVATCAPSASVFFFRSSASALAKAMTLASPCGIVSLWTLA